MYEYWIAVQPISSDENAGMRFLNDIAEMGWELVTIDHLGRGVFRKEKGI